jgi:hypothetical protein
VQDPTNIVELLDQRDLFKPLHRAKTTIEIHGRKWAIYYRNANRHELLTSAATCDGLSGFAVTIRCKWDNVSFKAADAMLDDLISQAIMRDTSKSVEIKNVAPK